MPNQIYFVHIPRTKSLLVLDKKLFTSLFQTRQDNSLPFCFFITLILLSFKSGMTHMVYGKTMSIRQLFRHNNGKEKQKFCSNVC